MVADMTRTTFNLEGKNAVEKSVASEVGVAKELVKASIANMRRRRRFLSSDHITLEVAVETNKPDSVTAAIQNENFESNVGSSISTELGTTVTVSSVSTPEVSDITTTNEPAVEV